MTFENIPEQLEFQAFKAIKVEAKFDTPEMTSDSGTLLLREVENHTSIVANLSSAIRLPSSIVC